MYQLIKEKDMRIIIAATLLIVLPFYLSLKKVEPKEEVAESVEEEKPGYTNFQIAMWYLKGHESFRPWEYPDGNYPSKGFGFNLSPDKIEWVSEVLGFHAKERNWTWEEGTKVLYAYWDKKYSKFNAPGLNEAQKHAVVAHEYNRGKYKNIRGCCGKSVGCGNPDENIRKSHNPRRIFEWKWYNGELTDEDIEAVRKRAIQVQQKWGKSQ